MGFKKTYAKIFPLISLFVFGNEYSLFTFSICEGQIVPLELFEINSTLFCNNRDIVCVQSLPSLIIEWILVGHGMISVHMKLNQLF
jgi:hypothetical protein